TSSHADEWRTAAASFSALDLPSARDDGAINPRRPWCRCLTRPNVTLCPMKTAVSICSIAALSLLHAQPHPKVFFQKGVNFTAEGPVGYKPDIAVSMLDRLREDGVNAIALVPYGFCGKTEPAIHFGGGWERAELIEAIAGLAHQRGMKVMLKPQLWGRGTFPGDIHFDRAEDRATWFENYRRFLEFYATLAARSKADIFCVGVEFVQMSRYEAEW